MSLFVQISDLHITSPGELLCDRVDTAAFLRRCIARINALDPRPDAVLATGDLVDQGNATTYATLRELLAPLAMPIYLMLGNHDDREAFRHAFPESPYRDGGEHIQFGFDAGRLRVLALDSNDAGQPAGRLCAARLTWLARQLEASRDRPVVIALHHPPFATGIEFMDACSLDRDDSRELAAIVQRHSNVERIICGHVHRPMHARFAGTIASTAPSCAHQVTLTFKPGAPASFTFEPPAFTLHLLVRNTLVSHHTYVEEFAGPYPF